LTGFSHYFQATDPALATRINPFNVSARMLLLDRELSDGQADQTQELTDFARKTIQYAPIQASAFAQLGEIHHKQGDDTTADALFDVALTLSETEGLALQRTMVRSMEEGDYARAMRKFDILMRRWPHESRAFAPIIPILLRQADGYDEALSLLKTTPPWRQWFLQHLNQDVSTVDLAYRFQLDLHAVVSDRDYPEIANAITGLLNAKRYDLAYRLFLLTQTEEDRLYNRYMFNGSFALALNDRPFNWALKREAGSHVSRKTLNNTDGQEFALSIRFMDKPVKRVGTNQLVNVPTGRYRFSVDLGATRLKAPKGLYWQITCLNPVRKALATLDIPAGQYQLKTLETEFAVVEGECGGILNLTIETDLVAESFRYRYSGELTVYDVSLTSLSL